MLQLLKLVSVTILKLM